MVGCCPDPKTTPGSMIRGIQVPVLRNRVTQRDDPQSADGERFQIFSRLPVPVTDFVGPNPGKVRGGRLKRSAVQPPRDWRKRETCCPLPASGLSGGFQKRIPAGPPSLTVHKYTGGLQGSFLFDLSRNLHRDRTVRPEVKTTRPLEKLLFPGAEVRFLRRGCPRPFDRRGQPPA